VKNSTHAYPPMKMEQTERFEKSAYKLQTPGNYPEESIQYSEQGESLKSRNQLKFEAVKGVILTALLYINQILIDCDRYCHLLRRTALSLTAWLGLSYLRFFYIYIYLQHAPLQCNTTCSGDLVISIVLLTFICHEYYLSLIFSVWYLWYRIVCLWY
jgi:hypothetical protein